MNYGDLTPEALAEKITKSGIEVDGIQYVRSEPSTNVVVGYVETCEKHPNADKLNLCSVDVGETENLQIICGAPNVAQGQKVVVAKPRAVLPGNFKIKKVKLRGIESNGMICSMKELGVDEAFIAPQFQEGIIVLDPSTEVGEDVVELLNLDDAILEFDLTPNRSDALNMIGVAYEVAAILDLPLNLPEPTVQESEEAAKDLVKVSIEDEDLCNYYSARIIKNIKVGPSPLWMQNALLSAGIRPINNVVDITNFVLMEYGQPLHAFDYYLVGTGEILVRTAQDSEELITLDDKNRSLNTNNLLITDGSKAIALAGVMGGLETEVNKNTQNILLEAANFDGFNIRSTVKETGLRSEASTRYEKRIDQGRLDEASLRACELLEKFAGGQVCGGKVSAGQLDLSEAKLTIHPDEVNRRLGTEISLKTMVDILRKLRFNREVKAGLIEVSIPTRRLDITIFEDMLEEIARIFGYDQLPFTLPANASKPGGLTDKQKLKRAMNQYLQSAGFTEAITYSLVSKAEINHFVSPEQSDSLHPVALAMPMSEDHQYLRTSLVPELINRLSYNVARKQTNINLYEIASVFLTEEAQLTKQPEEQLRLTAIATGKWLTHPWQAEEKAVDFYTLKGVLEGLFSHIDRNFSLEQTRLEDMHPGRTALIKVDGETIGFMGQVHPQYAKAHDLKDVYFFDLNVSKLLETTTLEINYTPVSKYPAITRDVAFVMDQTIHAGDMVQLIEETGGSLVTEVQAFDVYIGKNLKDNEKSVAFKIVFQDRSKTLTDEEINTVFSAIIAAAEEKYHAYVRS